MITAFDSGTFTGWAQVQGGLLVSCGLVRVHSDRRMTDLPDAAGGLVIIEKPIHRRQGKTVNPNNLIALGFKVGRLQETYLVLGSKVELIWPTDWKGGTPKEIQNDRDAKALTAVESHQVRQTLATIPDSYRNNVWDAIGIALWTARRAKERT